MGLSHQDLEVKKEPSSKGNTVLSEEKAAAKVLRQVIAGCVLNI